MQELANTWAPSWAITPTCCSTAQNKMIAARTANPKNPAIGPGSRCTNCADTEDIAVIAPPLDCGYPTQKSSIEIGPGKVIRPAAGKAPGTAAGGPPLRQLTGRVLGGRAGRPGGPPPRRQLTGQVRGGQTAERHGRPDRRPGAGQLLLFCRGRF